MTQLAVQKITEIVTKHFPNCEAIYLFGSALTKYFNTASDIDIAILLPFLESKKNKNFVFSDLKQELETALKKDVDLINIREVSTVFQKEIISSGKCIFYKDTTRKASFEGLIFSFYQKLNEERKDIINNFFVKNVRN